MNIVETHCHLDYLKDRPLAETLSLAAAAGVQKFVTIGVDPDNLDGVLALAQGLTNVWCTQGIHPHDAKNMTDEVLAKIRSRASHPRVVAIGEIGLDYYYNNSPKDVQLQAFRAQLEIAVEFERPIVIHSRDSDEDMMAFLREFGPKLKKKGVVHSFSSGPELAQTALDQGFYLGFNGMITFPKAENVRDAVRMCPVDRLLIETDSPFLTPVPHRGKENAPFYLPHVLKKMAELKGLEESKLADQLWVNSHALFGLD